MATASLGRLTLDLVAKIGNFTEPLNQAERKTKQVSDNMSKNLKVVASAAGIMAGSMVTASGALLAMAVDAAKADTQLAILANRAKISTTNFQILESAAAQLGVTQDQVGSIFADVQEKLGEFSATGAGGAVDFFDALKNNTKLTEAQIKSFSKTLQGKDGVEAVQLLKDKLDSLGASSQEQRFVFESLASDLGNLMPLFSDGGTLLGEYGKALEDAGVIKTKEAIEQSQILAAHTQALNIQFEGAKNQLIAGFTPALVDVASAMFNTSKNGTDLKSVGEGLGEVLKYVASVAIGVSTAIKSVGDGIGALTAIAVTAAKGDFSGVVAIYKDSQDQFDKLISSSGERFDNLWSKVDDGKNTTSELSNAILKFNQAQLKQSDGLKINTKEADENAKAKDKQAKAQEKLNREQEKARAQFDYAFSIRTVQMQMDAERQIDEIRKAAFSPAREAEYITFVKNRLNAEKDLFDANLAYEVSEHKLTEVEKANFNLALAQKEIRARTDINDQDKRSFLRAAEEKHAQELAWLDLEKRQRISDASESFRTDMENIAARYAFEREQILLNRSIGEDERKALLNASVYSQNKDESQVRDNTISDYRDVTGFYESPLVRQFEVLQQMRDLDLLNEEAYQKSKLDLTLKYGASYMDSMLGGFASLVDENSKTYAVLFAAQKAFAVAQAMLNIPQAYSKAYDAVVGTPYIGPYIAPAVGAAAAALQVAQAAQIKSVNLTGMAHDGISSIPEEGTWLLNKGERVLNPQDNKAFTDFINNREASGEPNITINNNTGANVSAGRGADGKLYVTIDEVDQLVAQSLERPSSKTSKAMNQFTNAGRRR